MKIETHLQSVLANIWFYGERKRVKGVPLVPALKKAINCTTAEQLYDVIFFFIFNWSVRSTRLETVKIFLQRKSHLVRVFRRENFCVVLLLLHLSVLKIWILFNFISWCKPSSVSCMSRKPSDLVFTEIMIHREDCPCILRVTPWKSYERNLSFYTYAISVSKQWCCNLWLMP